MLIGRFLIKRRSRVIDRRFVVVLSTFKGDNPETDAEAAMNSFFIHLEQDEERRNAAFLLKHLLIMDLVVE